ncbi:hypothetical protein [Rhizobium sp. ICMP 5592]|uniref:hypothetical protein n=1 Tax=Rhizobium sp. ICMP 5592 TaxID=2292445 RepID=UPI0025700976|nr:hypothetical protein [Rhizobium sp. ICMP 5592]
MSLNPQLKAMSVTDRLLLISSEKLSRVPYNLVFRMRPPGEMPFPAQSCHIGLTERRDLYFLDDAAAEVAQQEQQAFVRRG